MILITCLEKMAVVRFQRETGVIMWRTKERQYP